jgi:hypothetical protein
MRPIILRELATNRRRWLMDLDEVISAVFCLVDEALPVVTAGQRLRQRGPIPSCPIARC